MSTNSSDALSSVMGRLAAVWRSSPIRPGSRSVWGLFDQTANPLPNRVPSPSGYERPITKEIIAYLVGGVLHLVVTPSPLFAEHEVNVKLQGSGYLIADLRLRPGPALPSPPEPPPNRAFVAPLDLRRAACGMRTAIPTTLLTPASIARLPSNW
jgi:hypothetical protein